MTGQVRTRLSALTTRGRAFLAAGIAACVCALVLGQHDLLRVAIFLAALPLVTVLIIARTRYRISATRSIIPPRVPVGRQSTVHLQVENVGRIPTGLLLLEDKVPYVLGARPRFVLDRMSARWRRNIAYPVRSDVRGKYTIGPLTLRVTDPFGLVELSRAFRARDTLLVTPEVHPLPSGRLAGEWSATGESRPRAVAADGEEDVTVREYRDGDDLRRVHWRSSARRGELMVRREEQPWQSRATIFLDTRRTAHRGSGPVSSFEWAVSAAASIGIDLLRRGYAVRLITDAGLSVSTAGREAQLGGAAEGLLLDALAVVDQSRLASLDRLPFASASDGGAGLVVALLGTGPPSELEQLNRLRQRTTGGLAVVLDTPTWAVEATRAAPHSSSEADQAVDALRHGGWRVGRADSSSGIPAVWARMLSLGAPIGPAVAASGADTWRGARG